MTIQRRLHNTTTTSIKAMKCNIRSSTENLKPLDFQRPRTRRRDKIPLFLLWTTFLLLTSASYCIPRVNATSSSSAVTPHPFRHQQGSFLGRTRQILRRVFRKKDQTLTVDNSTNVLYRETQSKHDLRDLNESKYIKEIQEEEEEQRMNKSPISILASVLPSLFRDPQKVSRWAASGIQLGLALYLVHALWGAITEVIDEYSQEISGTDTSFVKMNEVSRLIDFLEQNPQNILQSMQKQSSDLPPLHLLQLAKKLVASGLPLRADENQPSVEKILHQLTRSEAAILQQCLWTAAQSPNPAVSIPSNWNKITGLNDVKDRLLTSITSFKGKPYSQHFASLFDHNSATGTTGILLYGPPGCGKTLLVKSLASVARVPCLVVTPSVLLRKYVGETNQQVRALFSLAHKLAPCILCIDELDGLFRERSESEHEVSRDLKTEFLQWMDGMLSQSQTARPILVIGATNRPFDVDSAILRRLSQSHFVGLPDATARKIFLQQQLSSVPTEESLNIDDIVLRTEGYSPSDLRQVLQTAALSGPSRESRPICTDDLLLALQSVPPTPMTQNYRNALVQFRHNMGHGATGNVIATNYGNFYDAGTLHIDHETFESLRHMMEHFSENWKDESSPGEDNDDEDLD